MNGSSLLRSFLLLLTACGPVIGTPPEPEDEHRLVVEARNDANYNVDVLFVVDDSGSMPTKTARLANSFERFVDALPRSPNGFFPDLHVGVISTDMGTTGSASGFPAPGIGTVGQGGCAADGKGGRLQLGQATGVDGTYLTDIALTDGTRQKNYEGGLAATLGLMTIGGGGCGFEQPLHAVRAALENNPANAGFLRRDAVLAVVFITDEDDCSVRDPGVFGNGPNPSFRCTRFGVTCAVGGQTPDAMGEEGVKEECTAAPAGSLLEAVEPFRDFLIGLKGGDASKVVVSGIMGPTDPVSVELRTIGGVRSVALTHSCTLAGSDGVSGTADDEVADPAVRLQTFFDLFPDRNSSSTICDTNYDDALENTDLVLGHAIGTACVSKPLLDVDPAAGLQPDCVVEAVSGSGTAIVPPCGAGTNEFCWRLDVDATACPAGEQLRLHVDSVTAQPADLVMRMRCLVQ